MLRAPAGFVSKLRRLVMCDSIFVVFDDEESEKRQRPVWSVMYLERGKPTFVCDWPHPLDGNLDALAARIRQYDYARLGVKQYARALDEKMRKAREARKRKRMDEWVQRGKYVRKAFQALADGGICSKAVY